MSTEGRQTPEQAMTEEVRSLLLDLLQAHAGKVPVSVDIATHGRNVTFLLTAPAEAVSDFILDDPARIMVAAVANSLDLEFTVSLHGSRDRLF